MGLPLLKVIQDVHKYKVEFKYSYVRKLVQIKSLLSAAITFLPCVPDFLTALEWKLIIDYLPILKPFDVMTTELSGEIYPTLSSVIPLVRGLQHTLKSITTQTIAENLLQKTAIDVIIRCLGI